MKFIGQYIQSLIARFRSDVYLENLSNPGSDTDKFLVVDTNNKIGFRTGAEVVSDGGGGVTINNEADNRVLTSGSSGSGELFAETNLNFTSSHLYVSPAISVAKTANSAAEAPSLTLSKFRSSPTAGQNGDTIAKIIFNSRDAASGSESYAQIISHIQDATDGGECGKISLQVANDNTFRDGLVVTASDTAEEVDVTIANGAASLTTIAGDLQVNSNFAVTFKSKKTILSTADCNDLHTTPIQVAPAGGANTVIVPTGGLIRVDRASTQDNSASNMDFHYEDKEPGTFGETSLFHIRRFMYDDAGDRVFVIGGLSGVESSQNLTDDVNKALEVSVASALTNNCFTSVTIYLTYNVIDIS